MSNTACGNGVRIIRMADRIIPIEIPPLSKAEIPFEQVKGTLERLAAIPPEDKAPKTGISQQEADRVAQWVTALALSCLQNIVPSRDNVQWSAHTSGLCKLGWMAVRQVTQNLPAHCMFGFNVGEFSPVEHIASIVRLPVTKQGGGVEWKSFLIDPTFAQFFYDHSTGTNTRSIGQSLLRQKGGAEFAHTLLRQGYIELTEDRAKLYLQSFAPGFPDGNSYTRDLFRQANHSYCAVLALPQIREVTNPVREEALLAAYTGRRR